MPDGTLEQKVAIDYVTRCNECGNTHLERDDVRGELVCESCGLVLEQNAIDSRGPRVFSPEEISRVHSSPSNPMRTDRGLGSYIGTPRDAQGKKVNTYDTYRLSAWQRRSHSVKPTLVEAYSLISQYSSHLGLPETVRDEALSAYRKAAKKDMIRGNSIKDVASAALFYACKVRGVPRTADEIIAVTKASRPAMLNINKRFNRELGLVAPPTLPQDYVPRFCSLLKLDNKIQNKVYDLLKQAEEKGKICGKSPVSIAAAAIYIATHLCENYRTQREISDVASVTEVTIRNRYAELTNILGIEIHVR